MLKSHVYMVNWFGEELMVEVICAWMAGIKWRSSACECMYGFVRAMGSRGLLRISKVWRYEDISMGVYIFVIFSREYILLWIVVKTRPLTKVEGINLLL